MVVAGRTGAVGVAGVVGAEENGGRDMFSASLVGAGRKGGTPRPLSNGGWVGFGDEARKSELIVLPVRPPARPANPPSVGWQSRLKRARRVCDV